MPPRLVAACAMLLASFTSSGAQIPRDIAAKVTAFEARMDSLSWESIAAGQCVGMTSANVDERARDYIEDIYRGVPRVPAGALIESERLYAGHGFTVDAIQIGSRIPGGLVRAYFGTPAIVDESQPLAIVLTGPGVIGPQAFGIRLAGDDSLIQFPKADLFVGLAQELMGIGMRVLVVELSYDVFRWPLFPWQDIARGGIAYAVRHPGASPAAPMIAQLLGTIDYGSRIAPRGVVLVGWEDGAQIANLVAMDPRVRALARLAAPVDRPRARRSAIGVKMGPTVLQGDCGTSEVSLARMIMPKPLLIMHYLDQVYRPFADAFSSQAVADSIGAQYAAQGQSQRFTFIALKGNEPWRGKLRDWLVDEQVASGPGLLAAVSEPGDARVGPLPVRSIIDATFTNNGALVRGGCTQLGLSGGIGLETDAQRASESLRARLRTDVRLPAQISRLAWVIDSLGVTPSFTILAYRGMDAGQLVGGIAAVPRTQLAHYPVVVSYNGVDGALPLLDRSNRTYSIEYLNTYGAVLAENGFVVLIPYVPNWFPDAGTSLLAMRGERQSAGWSQLLTNFRDGLTFALTNLPIDADLVTGYGISFGGEAALMHAALDARISRVLYSNPISRHATVFSFPDAAGLATWQNAICHYETALRERLVAPRAFLWENGINDTNGQSEDPLETVRAVQAFYTALGLGDRFSFIRHGGGHATRPNGQLLDLLLRR